MAKRKGTKGQRIIYKTLHRKQKTKDRATRHIWHMSTLVVYLDIPKILGFLSVPWCSLKT